MARKSPFKHHRFPRDIILCAVRWYLRYPLSAILSGCRRFAG